MRLLLTIFAFIATGTGLFGIAFPTNPDEPIPGEILVRFAAAGDTEVVLEDLNATFGSKIRVKKSLSHNFHIYLLGFEPTDIAPQNLLDALLKRREVVSAQWNYLIEWRTSPNDPFFDEQWTLERIGLPRVWEVTQGGLSANGDTIVVAVLDSGFDPTHEDLRDNIWNNPFEIPGDGIDNDQNGFIDDVNGWNFLENSPVQTIFFHGHSVAGIIGARGNNGIGVTGVNMQVRLMLFTIRTVDHIVAAYDYVIQQRQGYNQHGRNAGSFVVATNASFGQSRVFCAQQPVWGAMYDLLGEVGVLTGAATVNSNIDVDVEGDMPSSCPSDFIIAVLNTNRDDRKHPGSGFGKISIDLGSPGQDSYTISLNNDYGTFGGNSAAAPHLTGTIALLYSLPCPALASEARTAPRETALRIRDAILQGVDPLADLAQKTVTGGRLNAFNSMEVIRRQCSPAEGPLELVRIFPSPASQRVQIAYQAPDFESNYRLRIFDALGRIVHSQSLAPPRFGDKVLEIDVNKWAAGAYFVKLEQGKASVNGRFIVH
jgi:hypothetical protein